MKIRSNKTFDCYETAYESWKSGKDISLDGVKLIPITVLDKIRAEMFEEMQSHSGTGEEVIQAYADGLKKGLEILDKYKAESEEWENFADDLIPIIDEAESEGT